MSDREMTRDLIVTSQLRMAAGPLNRHMNAGDLHYYPRFWPREAWRRFADKRRRRKLMGMYPESNHLAFYDGSYTHESPAKQRVL